MKLHTSNTDKYQTVTGYDQSGVEINAQRYDYSVIVMPETPPRAWDVARFEDLTAEHFERIAADKPDVVVLGTGERQRFVHPKPDRQPVGRSASASKAWTAMPPAAPTTS